MALFNTILTAVKKTITPYTGLILIGVVLDQVFKYLAETHLSFFVPKIIVPHLISFQLVHNYGAAYGIFQHHKILLLTISFLALICFILFRNQIAPTRISKLALSFLFIGTLGNFIDRFVLGFVIDFIDIKLFPVFNLADICINIGVCLFILELLLDSFFKKKSKNT